MTEFEPRLSQMPLPEPPPALRTRMLAQARREHRWRTVERVWRWTLVAAAALLLIANLHFAQAHEREMVALVGPPGIERPIETKVFVQSLAHRQRLLTAWCSGEFPSELKEERL